MTAPPTAPSSRRRVRRRLLAGGAVLLALAVLLPVAWVQATGQARVRGSVAEAAADPVDAIVVLGAGLRPDGTPSTYLRRRLAAAAELWAAGAAPRVVLSGDGADRADGTPYDEPASMRDWIVGLGVPPDVLVLDREGYDTTATCRRAHDEYAVRTAVVVTQDYHLRRALFSCARAGLDATGVGVSATSVTPVQAVWWRVREVPASWKAAAREAL
ncbi:vancomycin permeability regulator SanA [Isoptericola jiangsuensis]|uniref:Vancomycin permeability regulator SanA n=1 Tax=Isoptericola jiangsuensis TaxID=548579 RepID=A0A2A9EVG7_9MICO|nr:YdcF family protein [Isoptericola jiangsuensis]PFG42272.1 vancomycin permeability regulator SanA [Isoptericola jiangsuensis]